MAYGHHWRTVERPAILMRAGWECQRCGAGDKPLGLVSTLQGCHLDGNPENGDETNLACLCRKCHRAHDYQTWALAFRVWLESERAKRIVAKDAARPILQMLAVSIEVDQVQALGNL